MLVIYQPLQLLVKNPLINWIKKKKRLVEARKAYCVMDERLLVVCRIDDGFELRQEVYCCLPAGSCLIEKRLDDWPKSLQC